MVNKILEWIVSILLLICTPMVFMVEYAVDAVLGNSYLRLGHKIIKKYPSIKSIKPFRIIWRRIQPKNMYIRYETPFVTYIFSYCAISFFSVFFLKKVSHSIIVSSIIYLTLYFVGMIRKFAGENDCLKNTLKRNLEFLKVSFLPFAFIITVFGFAFTVTGVKIQEIVDWENLLTKIGNEIVAFIGKTSNLYNPIFEVIVLLFKTIVVFGILFIVLYVISIPLQVVAYGIIMLIMYFIDNKSGYTRLWNKCLLFTKNFFESDNKEVCLYLIWNCPTNRRQYVVGMLIIKEQYEFKYCEDVAGAIDAGFKPLDKFENLNDVYKSKDLFDVFLSILTDKNTDDILKKYNIKKYDSDQLEKKNGAKLCTDNLEFIDHIMFY